MKDCGWLCPDLWFGNGMAGKALVYESTVGGVLVKGRTALGKMKDCGCDCPDLWFGNGIPGKALVYDRTLGTESSLYSSKGFDWVEPMLLLIFFHRAFPTATDETHTTHIAAEAFGQRLLARIGVDHLPRPLVDGSKDLMITRNVTQGCSSPWTRRRME